MGSSWTELGRYGTERSVRTRGIGSNALASSVVLVCRKRLADADIITRADFIRALKREMPAAIDAIRKAGVGPVDMQQSVIGPGMGVFSRHAKVLEDDDSAMTVKTALVLINRVWEEIENELDQAFDSATQVALAWFATYGFEPRASGELITLTTAKNTSDRALFASGVFEDLRGKTRLTPRDALPTGWSPASDKTLTVWECVQHTARVLNAPNGGGEAAAALVAQMGSKAEEARALAYRLFEIATQKGWAAEALVYNELAQEWTKLEDRGVIPGDRRPGTQPEPIRLRVRGDRLMSTEKETLQRVQAGLYHLRRGLTPFVEGRMKGRHGANWLHFASRAAGGSPKATLDEYGLLKTMIDSWRDVFDDAFARQDKHRIRNFTSMALEARNATSHLSIPLQDDEALRYLDAIHCLLKAVKAPTAEINEAKALYDAQRRSGLCVRRTGGGRSPLITTRGAGSSVPADVDARHRPDRSDREWPS